MKIKGLISEDFVNYKKAAMTIMFPHCNGFKCGAEYCQNSPLSKADDIEIDISDIVIKYLNNPITESVVMQGLEPFDSFTDLLSFITKGTGTSCSVILQLGNLTIPTSEG